MVPCTFDVNTNSTTNIGPLSLTVIKPAIVAKTINTIIKVMLTIL